MLKTFQIISAVFKRVQQNLSGDWGLLLLSLQIAHMINYTPTTITATHLLHLEVEAGSIAPPAKRYTLRGLDESNTLICDRPFMDIVNTSAQPICK